MKEASGELNMTVVTIVAIAAVGAFFYAFVWPTIQRGIAENSCKTSCANGKYTFEKDTTSGSGGYKCTCGDSQTK